MNQLAIWLLAAAPPVPPPVVETGATAFDRFVHASGRGLAQGSIYALVALGFVLVFKATQTVNFAQGAIALITVWFFSMLFADWEVPGRWLGDNRYVVWLSAVAAAIVLAVVVGLVIERTIIRPMIGEPLFSIAVITLGLEAVLRTVGTDAVAVNNRILGVPWGRDNFQLGGATWFWSWVATIAAAALAFVAVFLFFRTRTGIAMRAVAYDQEASLAQGISVGRVFAIAWGAGAALALLAALCASMWPIGFGTATAATASLGFGALPAVILGGLDSVSGALIGGLAIGVAEVSAGQYLGKYTDSLGSGYATIVPYIVMLLVLVVRPYGLFGTAEIRRV